MYFESSDFTLDDGIFYQKQPKPNVLFRSLILILDI
jgi:hypothetical protein